MVTQAWALRAASAGSQRQQSQMRTAVLAANGDGIAAAVRADKLDLRRHLTPGKPHVACKHAATMIQKTQ